MRGLFLHGLAWEATLDHFTETTVRASEALDASGSPSFNLPTAASRRGVLVVGADDCITSTDAMLCELFGVSPSDLIGRHSSDVVRNILKPRFQNPDEYEESWNWLRQHPDEVMEGVLDLSGEEKHVVHRYSAPLFDENHSCVGRVEIYSDITRRRELESAIRRAYQELKETQAQLVQSEKLRAVGEIASGVAHDFNNTLGIILGNLQLLVRSVDDENVLTRLQTVERAALDGVDTVRRIQEFTKTNPEARPSLLDLSELAAEAVEMMRPAWQGAAHAQGCSIDVSLDLGEGAYALGSGPEIREVLANIVLNAVQAMPEGGAISVSTGRTGKTSWIRVADTGIGMAEDVRLRIFDPFFTTRGVEGTGLGMSVAYGIVRRHGGTISVDSEVGKGSVITINLPSVEQINVEETEVSEEVVVAVTPVRILVVDDEEMFADVFVEMLSEFGHVVSVARSGAEAISRFKETRFDLVFTDLGMPQMSGWELAREIRSIDSRTPIILLTGWGASLEQKDVEESSIDMVLSKPVEFEKLASVIAEALTLREG